MKTVKMKFEKQWNGSSPETTFKVGIHDIPEASVDRWLKRGATLVSGAEARKAVTAPIEPTNTSDVEDLDEEIDEAPVFKKKSRR